ncbi:MAG: hypothetical protein ACTTIC_08400 [Helicobacteraceae bacterium]
MKGLFRALLICFVLCTDLGANKTNQVQAKQILKQDHKPPKQLGACVDRSC